MCNAYGSDELAPLDDWHDIGIGHPSQHLTVRRGAGFRKSAQVGSQGALPSSKGTSVHYKQAITATVWSIVVTIVFGLGVVWPWKGSSATVDFATAFLVEKSLSVDNLFVFLMIFEYFKVPEAHTQRVLKWGILTALLLRGVMIGLGVAVVTRFRPVLLLFALILIVSSYKMLQPEEDSDLADNPVMKIARRLVKATDNYDGDRFFTRERGVRRATPMLVVLVCIELSDVVFAVDSIPAVVGISQARDTHHASNHQASNHHASHATSLPPRLLHDGLPPPRPPTTTASHTTASHQHGPDPWPWAGPLRGVHLQLLRAPRAALPVHLARQVGAAAALPTTRRRADPRLRGREDDPRVLPLRGDPLYLLCSLCSLCSLRLLRCLCVRCPLCPHGAYHCDPGG